MCISQTSVPPETQAIIDAERAFARMAREKSRKEAFLANMDQDSILFRPGPVPGIPATEKEIKGTDLLAWAPLYADSAVSGDLGFTTGPWTFQQTPTGPIQGRGFYFTIWRKTGEGFKFVLDLGAPVPHEGPFPTDVKVPAKRGHAAPTGSGKLIALEDEALNKSIEGGSLSSAVSSVAHEEIHAIWPLEPLTGGKAEVGKMLTTKPVFKDYKTLGSGTSKAGDFAYSYGSFLSVPKTAEAKPAGGHYVRIWKRDESMNWRLSFLLSAAPRPQP